MKRWLSLFLALSLLAAVAPPARAQACLFEYTVQVGDNLYRIGLKYSIPPSVIAAVNNLANPNLIFVGQVLCIPAPATPGPSPTPGPSATPGPTATPTKTATPGPTATGAPTAVPTVVAPPASGIPTFSIVSVVRNTSVTIRTANFPANQLFDVSMGPIGSLGVGHAAGTVNSGAGGVFTTTLTIPAAMLNAGQIAVRLQSASGYYSYGWFYNTTYP